MPHPPASRPPGRPKSEGKRAAIIEAARLLFLENSYDAVTMEQVAVGARVAKMTVYSHFHDKESLFEAIVRATSDMIIAALPTLPRSDGDQERELVTFGCAFLEVLLSQGVINSMHRHIDVLARNRVLAERVYHAGPGRTRATLAAYLSTGPFTKIPFDDSIEAASDLMNLWLGDLPQQLALGLTVSVTQDQIAQRVRRCTRLFLRAHGLHPGVFDGLGSTAILMSSLAPRRATRGDRPHRCG